MTTTTTLADVAATSLSAVRTLERYSLDYCCGGKQPFDEACAAKGLKPESVMQEIARGPASGASERDWQTAPLNEIVKHIVGTHHEYLKLELPALGNRMNKVLSVHGSKDSETLGRLAEVFGTLRAEMEAHMQKEELMLFPFLAKYGRAETLGQPLPPVPFGSVANPIGVMERERLKQRFKMDGPASRPSTTLTPGEQARETSAAARAAVVVGPRAHPRHFRPARDAAERENGKPSAWARRGRDGP